MQIMLATPLTRLADASAAANDMQSYIVPLFATLIGIATLGCVAFLVIGAYHYITSAGRPDRLERAKKIIRNALIGLAIVVAAGALTAILKHSFVTPAPGATLQLPQLEAVKPESTGWSVNKLLIDAINGLLLDIVQTVGKPLIDVLASFTTKTPLMAENLSVFNMWLVVLGIADVLFILVIALLGFHIMSAEALGLDEIEFKHLLPQIGLIFLLVNTSIFAIDAVIRLSNAVIHALMAGFPVESLWTILGTVLAASAGLPVAGLLILVAFLILAVILLVYYIMRLVVLFLGAVLSPLVLLLWLLPSFRDFSTTAIKSYITTIWVLFVHVVILMLAGTVFSGTLLGTGDQSPNPIMAAVLGVATLTLLIKTQGTLTQMSYMSSGPRAARQLGKMFANSSNHAASKAAEATSAQIQGQLNQAKTKYVVNTIASKG